MELTIFAKKKKAKSGKEFYTYLTTLTRKDGTEDMLEVKFREECGAPKNCPCNIAVEKSDINISKKNITREDTGELIEVRKLWVSAWSEGSPYEDKSLDDYDI